MLSDPKVEKYVDGIALHWYIDPFVDIEGGLDKVNEEFPDKFLLYSEACNGERDSAQVRNQRNFNFEG